MKKIIVGTDNFEKLIRADGYYIDKTELIYDLAHKTGNEVNKDYSLRNHNE